jgi:uncharacterized spore protein YtfJ
MNAIQDPQPAQGQETFVERLAGVMGGAVHAQSVYGQPVERDGVTLIPVARVRYGFGGGGRKNGSSAKDEGAGGGGGAQVFPVGFISVRGGSAEFRSIPDPAGDARKALALFAGAGLGAWLVLRGIRGLFRR